MKQKHYLFIHIKIINKDLQQKKIHFDQKLRNNLVKNDLYSNISLSRNSFHNIVPFGSFVNI